MTALEQTSFTQELTLINSPTELLYQNRVVISIREKTLNLFPGKNRACSKMAPRKRREMRAHEWSRDRLLRGG